MSDERRKGGRGDNDRRRPVGKARQFKSLEGSPIASDSQGAREPALPRHLQGHIGRQLRAVYAELVNEPVPDKIHEVLRQLEAKEAREDGE